MNEYKSDFSEILTLLKRGIVPKKHKGYLPVGSGDTLYMGCPGKQLFYALPRFSSKNLDTLVPVVAELFPKKVPSKGVQYSVFWRYFYGVFSKRGVLNKKCADDTISVTSQWESVYFPFVDRLFSFYSEKYKNKHYGLVLAAEMRAHRNGDLYSIAKNDNKEQYLKKMISMYENAHSMAVRISAHKNAFSSLYWCAMYLYENENKMFVEYAVRFLKAANQHATSVLTKGKVVSVLNRLKIVMSDTEFGEIIKMYRAFDNKVMRSFGFKKLSFDKSVLF